MAPSAVIDERKQNKNKNNKKNKKETFESEMEQHESQNPPKKNKSKDKKRKLESSLEINGDDEMRDNSGSKQKNKKKKHQQRRTNSPDEEENDAGEKIITDERFATMRQDPLFRRMRRKENKVVIDSRFDKIFKDKNFAGSAAPVDKRGRPKNDEKGKRFLMQHYLNQERELEERDEEMEKKKDSDEEVEVQDKMRLELSESDDVSVSDESGSDDDDDDDDDDENSVNSDIVHYLMANHDDTPTIENETYRLAVVNLDWTHLKAVDLYVVMNSCLPKGGKILSVSVYPSEFGLKCMDIEATHGPTALLDIRPDDNKADADAVADADVVADADADADAVADADDNDVDVHDDVEVDVHDDDDVDVHDDDDDEDEDASDFDEDTGDENEGEINNKLRTYELNKLRYYFAVVVCDSSETANHVYKTLDGTELLKTSNVFDLRFIPDSMEFNHPPRDVATEAPVNYKEPDFETRALQHSKVKLTWEDEEPERKKILRRKFNTDELDELSMYLASTDDSEDEENDLDPEAKKQATREKFLSLLNSGNNSDSEKSEGGDKEGEMEITFNTDLEALGKKIVENKDKSEETVWEAVLRKQKEKKKARKMSQSMQDNDDDDDHGYDYASDDDDFFMEEPTEKKVKEKAKRKDKGKRREEVEETGAATQAELELLLAGDEDKSEKKGYNMKRLKAKGKKGKKEINDVDDKFPDVNVKADQRFSALVNSHEFALDPTDPQYKRTPAYLKEKFKNPKKTGKKGAKHVDALENPENRKVDHVSTEKTSSKKHELSAAIRSVMKNLPKS